MNLHDHLTDTLDRIDGEGPDLDRLTATARTRGGALRRRRTASLATAACVAALTLTGGVVSLVSGADGSAPVASDPGTADAPVVTPDLQGQRAATTGQSAVLALRWAVDQQREGVATELAGQLSATSGDYYVELHWEDADGLGSSLVGLNVTHDRGEGRFKGCTSEMVDCIETRLPDGSRLISAKSAEEVPDGTGRSWGATLVRPDHLRISVGSTNGFEGQGGVWDLRRNAPPLSLADAEAIVQQPVWGDTMPVAFVEAGTRLTDYRDVDDHGGWIRGTAVDAGR